MIKGRKLILTILTPVIVLTMILLGAVRTNAEEITTSDYTYTVIDETEKTAMITAYNGSDTTIEIPSQIEGYTIVKIGDKAFYNQPDLASVTIPDTVTAIGQECFEYCESLTSVTLSPNLVEIGKSAFAPAISLSAIEIPDSVTTIGERAFSGCKVLASVQISENSSLANVGEAAFRGCESLLSFYIPKNMTEIPEDMFISCKKLKSVSFASDSTVAQIGESAFMNCIALTGITLPEGVTTINEDAFSYCEKLETVNLPSTITTIGDNAFFVCYDDDGGTGLKAINMSSCTSDGIDIGEDACDGSQLLETVDILKYAKSLGNEAFSQTAIKEADIPAAITVIPDRAFSNCE